MDAATDPADQWHVLPWCVRPPARSSRHIPLPRPLGAAVSSPTPTVLDASFVSMVANLRSTSPREFGPALVA